MSKVVDSKLKYNWSGHVTMDTAMNGFFKEIMHKTETIDVKFRHGMLPKPYVRNPLKPEKSPRTKSLGFDFSVPSAQTEPERWHFPENDWGLVSKFPSQKQVFEKIRAREKEYTENVQKIQAARSESEQQVRRDVEPIATSDQNQVVSDSRQCDSMSYSFDAPAAASSAGPRRSSKPVKSFYKQPVSTIKSLGSENPEMLASWRAHRAADFVAKQRGDPLKAPAIQELDCAPFRPPGSTLVPAPKREDQALSSLGRGGLETLRNQLLETESAIDKQKLKLSRLRK